MLSNYFVDIETTDDEEEITTVSPTSVMMTGPSKKRTTKKKKKKKDPNAPKRNMSAYVIFSVHIRPSVKEENPEASFGDIARIISAKYKALDANERKEFDEKAAAEKARYQHEKEDYNSNNTFAADDDDDDDDDDDGNVKKTKKRCKKDPDAPTRGRTAYTLFSMHIRPIVKEENPGAALSDVTRIIRARFKALDANERKEWDEKVAADKIRYELEMEDYNAGRDDDEVGTTKKKKKAKQSTKKKKEKENVGAVSEFDSALANHFAAVAEETDEDSNEEEVEEDGGYSNEHVSLKFFDAFPDYQNEILWMPVNKLVVNGKLSPQSGKVLQMLQNKYGSEDEAWNKGWRWHMTEHNHMWYPPKFEYENVDQIDRKIQEYNTLVESYSRGINTKHKGSIASGTGGSKIKAVLNLIDEIELKY